MLRLKPLVYCFAFGTPLVAWLLLAPGRTSVPWVGQPVEPALPQHPFIQVYFNQARSSRYTDYRGLTRYGNDLEAQIVTQLNRAQISVEIAIHELNLPGVALALADCRRRKVSVRLVLEHRYNQSFATVARPESLPVRERTAYSQWFRFVDEDRDGRLSAGELSRRDPLLILERAGVERIDDRAGGTRGSAIMHHKFIVIDGVRVVTGSANFTLSDIHGDADDERTLGNVNHLVVLESVPLAELFRQEFALMWGDGPAGAPDSRFGRTKPSRPAQNVQIGDAEVTVQFGPGEGRERINALIASNLARAHKSVDFALFVFSAPELTEAVQNLMARGVLVRGALDPGFAYRAYSASLDLWGIRRCSSVAVPVLSSLGVALLPRGDKLHHKFALIDDDTVITGSHNWSTAADVRNDESILVIKSSTVAAYFEREFARIYRHTLLGPPRRLPVAAPCKLTEKSDLE